jgi:hypothetical protein
MNLKTRLFKLEQVKKTDICLVHYLPKVDGENWDEECTRYRLKLGLKKNEIVFLSYPEDLEA